MIKSQKTANKILKNDLRFFKQRPRHRTVADFVEDNSSGITSWSSNASMQYRKFNAEALVLRALKGLSERNGSSVVAIKKYIINHYPYVDGKFSLAVIRKIIRKALLKGKVALSQGTNIDGLFKISAGEIRAEQQQEQFKHYKECVRIREQQKLEMERRINKCRVKEEKRRKLAQQRQAARIKRQMEVVNKAKVAKAGLPVQAAKEMIRFIQDQQKPSPAMISPAKDFPALASSAALRLGAGTSRSFQKKPQIVDYADAAIETAKVISSEQLRHAIIKNAEYTPLMAAFDNANSPAGTSRCMPIKYEKTIRRPIWAPTFSAAPPSAYNAKTKITQIAENFKTTELNRDKKQVTGVAVNFPPPPEEPTFKLVAENVTRAKGAVPATNVRKVTKRLRGNAKANTVFKITKVLR